MRYSADHRVPPPTRIGGQMPRQRNVPLRIASAFRGISAAVASPAPRGLRFRHPADPEIVKARSAVVVSGLPRRAVRAAERRGQIDWRPLAAALDSLYIAKGGAPGVRMFLTTPQRSLSGSVPAELIAHKGELQRVASAAYRESVRARASRTR